LSGANEAGRLGFIQELCARLFDMPVKRDSIFNALIESCDSYEAVPNVTRPGNYYAHVREIRRQAVRAELNDSIALAKLTADLQILWHILSRDQRGFFEKHHTDAHEKKIEGC
jgi:hypothetical protein